MKRGWRQDSRPTTDERAVVAKFASTPALSATVAEARAGEARPTEARAAQTGAAEASASKARARETRATSSGAVGPIGTRAQRCREENLLERTSLQVKADREIAFFILPVIKIVRAGRLRMRSITREIPLSSRNAGLIHRGIIVPIARRKPRAV
jgi:hypothetical protein